jgi:hypothetical protein
MTATSQGPGWWLASDGRWYPPNAGTAGLVVLPGAVEPAAPMPTGAPPSEGEPAPTGGTAWELAEGVAAALLVAAVLRFAAAVVATVIGGYPAAPTHGERLGLLLQSAFEYADGQGVLLLLAVLGLLWWQAAKWSERRWIVQHHYDAPSAAVEVGGHLARTRRLLRSTGLLFTLNALGGLALIAGVVFEYIGSGPWRMQWDHIAGAGAIEAAYVLVSVTGLIAVRRLLVGLRAQSQGDTPA